jgi:hypothetical protein
MAWTKTSEGKDSGYAVYSTTLTPIGDTVSSKRTSVIDFIPVGCDFTVIANTASSNLSASAHIELWASYDKAPTWGTNVYRLKETPFLSLTGDVDNTYKVAFRDVSTYGQYPYYFLKIGFGGTDAVMGGTGNATVTMKIIVGERKGTVNVL